LNPVFAKLLSGLGGRTILKYTTRVEKTVAQPCHRRVLSGQNFLLLMKRSSSSEGEEAPGTYLAAMVSPDVREYMARVADALLKEGVSYKRQREIASEAGYCVSESTFRRHRAAVSEGRDPLSADKRAGRPRYLSARKVMVFVGWVLHQKRKKRKSWTFRMRFISQATMGVGT
jgi:transposase